MVFWTPSDTGAPGGKRIGQHMTHYIIKGGECEQAFNVMPQEYTLPFTSLEDITLLFGGNYFRPTGISRFFPRRGFSVL